MEPTSSQASRHLYYKDSYYLHLGHCKGKRALVHDGNQSDDVGESLVFALQQLHLLSDQP
jgi:hypothetical protein